MTPRLTMELQARKLGWAPPPRSSAADAHGCIMVPIPSGSAAYKVVAPFASLTASSPRNLSSAFASAGKLTRPGQPAAVLVTVKDKSLRDGPAAHP